jgi:hypothetical protein
VSHTKFSQVIQRHLVVELDGTCIPLSCNDQYIFTNYAVKDLSTNYAVQKVLQLNSQGFFCLNLERIEMSDFYE